MSVRPKIELDDGDALDWYLNMHIPIIKVTGVNSHDKQRE